MDEFSQSKTPEPLDIEPKTLEIRVHEDIGVEEKIGQ
jgi:hypothetical protein